MKLAIILGSTRKNRAGERVATFVMDRAKSLSGWDVELLDLAILNLPIYNEAVQPSSMDQKYDNEAVQQWSNKIAESDAYIIITPEYNHSIPASLKNAIDWLFAEWDNKSAGIVSYSDSLYGGARATEHLRNILNEMGIAVVKTATSIGSVRTVIDESGNTESEGVVKTLDKELALVKLWGEAMASIR